MTSLVRIVLIDPSHPGNIGSVARAMKNMALSDLVLVRIPANPEYCSLNLAMSVQLAAYEIFMAREQPQSHTQLEMALAPSGDVEHFYTHLHEVLNEIDFEDRTGHLMERLRRLFNRAQLDRNELNILRGILSAVQGRRGQSAQRSRK